MERAHTAIGEKGEGRIGEKTTGREREKNFLDGTIIYRCHVMCVCVHRGLTTQKKKKKQIGEVKPVLDENNFTL